MTNCLRTFVATVLCAAAMGSWAQAPQSGTYRIKGANGKYVEVKGKYYAQPNAAAATDYTTIHLGVGYSTGDGYRVFSLTGTNPTDGSQIEVYDYIQKACNIVSNLAQDKLNGKIESFLENNGLEFETEEEKAQFIGAIDAMADSICRIYTDDYAYMTIVPEGHYGQNWTIRAKATVPAIPYSIEAVGDYLTKGHVVNAGHSCTGIWDWAKQHVLKYLNEHQTNYQLKNLVEVYLDQVNPGTTYYLTCEDNETFGYETTPSDAGLWTLEAIDTQADGLATGTYNIKNNQTQLYVNMKGQYDAEPELTLAELQGSTANKQNAAFALDFGRYSKKNENVYRITELSNQNRNAVAYIAKGMNKAFEILNKKLTEKDLYTKLATKLNEKTGASLTNAQLSADVKTAIDLCAQHYAFLNLQDNTDGTVSLFVNVPEVPLLLNYAAALYQQLYQGKGNDEISTTPFEDLVKEQLDKYFADETSQTDQHLRNLWQQNRDKWHFGQVYYLSAEATSKTFEFTTTATDASTKWVLADINDYESTTSPFTGYFRVKNVGGYQPYGTAPLQQYVEVTGRASADVATAGDDKFTKAGTVIYVNMDNNAQDIMAVGDSTRTVKAYEVLNLRSQGIDVLGGAEASMEDLAAAFDGSIEIGDDNTINITPAYNGYIGFARYMLYAAAMLGESKIASHASDWWDLNGKPQGTQADVDKCKAVLDEFVQNYLPELKLKVYMIPAEGKADTYYIRSMVPSLKPIADFYKTHKADMDTLVIPSMDRFLRYGRLCNMLDKVGFMGEYFTYADEGTVRHWNGDTFGLWDYAEKTATGQLKMYSYETETIDNGDGTTATSRKWKEDASGQYYRVAYSTILNDEWLMFNWMKLQAWHALEKMGYDANSTLGGYLRMIHYGVPYFLIQGDNHDASGNRTYVGNTSLGFANDGAVHDTYNDLANAGDHALWQLEPVDETNYFAVQPNKNQGKNGKYYSSVYVDFPFQTAGSNATAVYALNSDDGVQTGTDKVTGEAIKYVTFNKQTSAVPAATPAIIETSQNNVDGTIALVPVANGERSEQNELIQGTFFGGYHNVQAEKAEDESTTASIKAMLKNLKNGSIQTKYGVTTDGMDLYLWGFNKKDERNPYGFYLYSQADNFAKNNIIPGNKPFLIQDPNDDSAAKVYVQLGDDELTGISELFSDEATTPANAKRYNLAGQRVSSSYKGIVVVNGQKIIQK